MLTEEAQKESPIGQTTTDSSSSGAQQTKKKGAPAARSPTNKYISSRPKTYFCYAFSATGVLHSQVAVIEKNSIVVTQQNEEMQTFEIVEQADLRRAHAVATVPMTVQVNHELTDTNKRTNKMAASQKSNEYLFPLEIKLQHQRNFTIYFSESSERDRCHITIVKRQGFSNLLDQYHVRTNQPEALTSNDTCTVVKAYHRRTSEKVAIKVVCKSQLTDEVSLLCHFQKQSNFVTLLDHFADEEYLYLITTWMPQIDLRQKFVREPHFYLTESEIRGPLYQIVTALRNLHELGYTHNAVRPDHIFIERFVQPGSNLETFGCRLGGLSNAAKTIDSVHNSKVLQPKESISSPIFMAPEVIDEGRVTSQSDVWSLGVTLYAITCGTLPNTTSAGTLQTPLVWDETIRGEALSSEFKTIVESMLRKDYMARVSPEQLLEHAWFFDSSKSRSL